jgi:hypothetical protein
MIVTSVVTPFSKTNYEQQITSRTTHPPVDAKTMTVRRTDRKVVEEKQIKTIDEFQFKTLEVKWAFDYDILAVNNKIMEYLRSKNERRDAIRRTIDSFKTYSKPNITLEEIMGIRTKIEELQVEMNNLGTRTTIDYIAKCGKYITEYKALTRDAPKVFGQKSQIDVDIINKRTRIVEEYLNLAKDFCPMNIIRDIKSSMTCNVCNSIIIDDGSNYICSNCSSIHSKIEVKIKYDNLEDYSPGKDINQRATNFNDVILQVQANFPITIPPKILEMIRETASNFQNFDITKITTPDLYKIMCEDGLSFWYKHINKVRYELTTKKPKDYSKYDNNVRKRVQYLNKIYDEIKDPDRSNFMHALYLYWQCLMNEGCIPDMDDFYLLKGRSVEYSNIEVLTRGFDILSKSHPEMSWKIFELP